MGPVFVPVNSTSAATASSPTTRIICLTKVRVRSAAATSMSYRTSPELPNPGNERMSRDSSSGNTHPPAPTIAILGPRPPTGSPRRDGHREPGRAEFGGRRRLDAAPSQQVQPQARPTHPFARQRDRGRLEVRARWIQVRRVPEPELQVDRCRDLDETRDLV